LSPAPPSQNPRLPADLGLPALGLLAQLQALFVTAYLVLVAFVGILPYSEGGSRVGVIGLLILGTTRAGLHNAAGRALTARSPLLFGAVRRYIIAAVVTTLAMGAILTALIDGVPLQVYVVLVVLCLAWPAALGVLVFRRDVRAAFDAADTFDLSLVPGDRSIEGVGVLMTVLASVGLAAALMGLTLLLELWSPSIEIVLLVILAILLAVRAALHLDAGIRAIRGVTLHRFDQLAARYLYIAVGTVGAFALFLLISSHGRGLPLLVVTIMLGSLMLMAWPLVVRRFAIQVRFDDIGDADQVPFGPAPDRGLTAFGYLLAVLGTSQLAMSLAALLVGTPDIGMLMYVETTDVPFEPMQLVAVGTSLVTLWAAREAIVMSARRHVAIYVYAAVMVAAAALDWIVDGFPLMDGHTATAAVATVALLGAQVAVPLTGVLLVRRRLPPREESTPPRGVPAVD
jgi:hypothetical protein